MKETGVRDDTEAREADEALQRALNDGAGLPWSHCRLMVLGGGGSGKTSTLATLAGKPLDSASASTVGAQTQTLQLRKNELIVGHGAPLQKYEPTTSELAVAAAAHAAVLSDRDAALPPERGSVLDRLTKDEESPGSPHPRDPAPGPHIAPPAAPAKTEPSTPGAQARAPGPNAAHAPHGAAAVASAGPVAAPAAASPSPPPRKAEVAPPEKVAAAMVLEFRSGKKERNKVLTVYDSGGQDYFADLHDIMNAAGGTMFMVVFSLVGLQDRLSRDQTIDQLVGHLNSIALHAASAPVLLVGTRKDQVEGGDAELRELSELLDVKLSRRCNAAFQAVVRGSRCCFCRL